MSLIRGNRQIGAAVFLIGIGIIAFLDFWWPGIMFVIGAAALASEYAETGAFNTRSSRVIGAAVAIVIGLLGLIDFNINWGVIWPLILIGVGILLLTGRLERR